MISKRMSQIKTSPTMALAAKAQELKRMGEKVISLAIGEPDWETLQVAKEAGIQAIKDNKTTYTPAKGIHELRLAISKDMNKNYSVMYSPDTEITVGAGAKIILFGLFQCLLNSDDEVIVPAPYWLSYPSMIELAQGKAVHNQGGKLTPKDLESLITERTKILLLNSPSNPTGEVYSKEELLGLASVLKKHPEIHIICDDIYNKLYYKGDIAPSLIEVAPELKERISVVNGASKSFAMTGWRVGWCCSNPEITSKITAFLSQSTGSPCNISQQAAVAALEKGNEDVNLIRNMLKDRKNKICQKLDELGLSYANPEGAFYLWIDIKPFLNNFEGSADFCEKLLEKEKVIAVAGAFFGQEGYIRISFATELNQVLEALDKLKSFINN